MKKNYAEPELEVVLFKSEDVITTSGEYTPDGVYDEDDGFENL